MDLGIEFPDNLWPVPAEGGSLDEALKVRAPSLMWSAPGESLDTTKILLIKFDAKEDAEIIQADALSEMCLLSRMLVTTAMAPSLKRTTYVTACARSAFHLTW